MSGTPPEPTREAFGVTMSDAIKEMVGLKCSCHLGVCPCATCCLVGVRQEQVAEDFNAYATRIEGERDAYKEQQVTREAFEQHLTAITECAKEQFGQYALDLAGWIAAYATRIEGEREDLCQEHFDEMVLMEGKVKEHVRENYRLRAELRGMEVAYQIAIQGLKNVYSESPNKKAKKIAMAHYKDATARLAELRREGA